MLTRDAYGQLDVNATEATALVVSAHKAEATRFMGEGVDYALTKIFRETIMREIAEASMGLREPIGKVQWQSHWATNYKRNGGGINLSLDEWQKKLAVAMQ